MIFSQLSLNFIPPFIKPFIETLTSHLLQQPPNPSLKSSSSSSTIQINTHCEFKNHILFKLQTDAKNHSP